MPLPKIKRSDLKPGECLCDYCTAKCCRYFALPLETPKTYKDFDDLRWYMFHGNIWIFVESKTWYLMVNNNCQHLMADNRCGIYETRPNICRKYSTDNCEYDDDACYDKLFETADQLWEYAEAVLPPRKRARVGHGTSLPILSGV